MKRELTQITKVDICCPGHDRYPCQTYSNRRSKKARAKGKTIEHKLVRTINKRNLAKELNNLDNKEE